MRPFAPHIKRYLGRAPIIFGAGSHAVARKPRDVNVTLISRGCDALVIQWAGARQWTGYNRRSA
jgi:hypothetical protein